MNKAMIESYLRNLLGVVLALVVTAMTNAGVASPLELATSDWLVVLNGIWAAAVPTLLRYVNKKDPAFGLIAKTAAAEVTKKIEVATETAKAAEKKAAPKKPAAKKTAAKK
jgi:hypothetical protein